MDSEEWRANKKKVHSWAGAKAWQGQIMEGPEGFREELALSDMDHCKVLGQREFYSETRIWGKSN